MNIRKLFVLFVIVVLLVPTAAAAPLAGPCMPGATYDPACDADQDGSITVADIQLTAGHWNQSGTFVSDSNHDHLGQAWTGAGNPLTLQGTFGAPDWAPLILNNSAGPGLRVGTSGGSALWVESAGNNGLLIDSAGNDGVHVGLAGQPSASTSNSGANGFEVAGAQGDGLYVGRADDFGVRVNSAGGIGLYVGSAGTYGLYVNSASNIGVRVNSTGGSGLYVESAGSYGLLVDAAGSIGVDVTGTYYAGFFSGDVLVTGNCTGCRQANYAVNAGSRALQPGDAVSVQGITWRDFDSGPALWQAVPAQPGQVVAGVVTGRAELVTQEEHRATETGKRLVPREGAAQPGDYVTIVYSGPVQVKVAPDAGAIAAGGRVTAAAGGAVRPLGTIKVQLADGAGTATMSEDAPVLGVALEAPRDGMVWVLVALQ